MRLYIHIVGREVPIIVTQNARSVRAAITSGTGRMIKAVDDAVNLPVIINKDHITLVVEENEN